MISVTSIPCSLSGTTLMITVCNVIDGVKLNGVTYYRSSLYDKLKTHCYRYTVISEHCTYCFVQVNDATPVCHFGIELLKKCTKTISLYSYTRTQCAYINPCSELRTDRIYVSN